MLKVESILAVVVRITFVDIEISDPLSIIQTSIRMFFKKEELTVRAGIIFRFKWGI